MSPSSPPPTMGTMFSNLRRTVFRRVEPPAGRADAPPPQAGFDVADEVARLRDVVGELRAAIDALTKRADAAEERLGRRPVDAPPSGARPLIAADASGTGEEAAAVRRDLDRNREILESFRSNVAQLNSAVTEARDRQDGISERLHAAAEQLAEQRKRADDLAGSVDRLAASIASGGKLMEQTRDAFVARDAARSVELRRRERRMWVMSVLALLLSAAAMLVSLRPLLRSL